MEALWTGIKALKLWQYLVMVAVLTGAAGATYSAYAGFPGSGGQDLEDNQQLIPVQFGNLVNQVTTNGSLVFPNRETLTFGSTGTVAEVSVEEGQQVAEGQALVRLDQTTVASLERAAAQARVNLQDSLDALDLVTNPPALDLALAHSSVADAELQLQRVLETLANAREPYTQQEIEQQESVVANARLTLRDADQSLVEFPPEHGRQLAQARQAEADAQVTLQEAQDALAAFAPDHARSLVVARQARADAQLALEEAMTALADISTVTSEQIVQAESNLLAAQNALETAQDALSKALDPATDEAIQDQERAVATAQEDLEAAERGLPLTQMNSDLTLSRGQDDVDTALALWQDALARFESATSITRTQREIEMNAAAQAYSDANADLGLARLSVEEDLAAVQRSVDRAGQTLQDARDALDAMMPTAATVQEREIELALAEAAVVDAQDALDALIAGPDKLEVALQQALVDIARSDLNQASEDLERLELGPGTVLLQQLLSVVAVAQADLEKTQTDLASLVAGPDPLELASREATVAVAGEALSQAERDLDDLLLGADLTDVAAKEEQVAVAQATVAEAREALAELLLGPDLLQVGLKEAEVATAQLALEESISQRENATLRAPMTGFVALVNVEAGDEVGPNMAIVEVVDPTVVEVDGIVDEIDVLLIGEGARAAVTMDSLPGQTLEGTISAIAPAALNQQGVVTYPIRIQMNVPEGIQLREGLSAVANIILRQENDVLLVPQQALYGSFDRPVVWVMTSSGIQERPVVLGNSDDFWTVVRQGLAEGEQVVMEVSQTTSDPFAAFRQLREGFGGGGFGGGRPSGAGDGGGRR